MACIGYITPRNLSKSTFSIPLRRMGFSSLDPSTSFPSEGRTRIPAKMPEFDSKYLLGALKRLSSTYINVGDFAILQRHPGATHKKYHTLQIIQIVSYRSLVSQCFVHD